MVNDLSIVIQGRLAPHAIPYLEKYFSFSNDIVVSLWRKDWENEEFRSTRESIHPYENRIKLILNEEPSHGILETRNRYNIYRQVYSTLQGLRQISSSRFIKIRGDEYYSDLTPVINAIETNPTKIVTGNFNFRIASKYHISDHLFGGNKVRFINALSDLECELRCTNCDYDNPELAIAQKLLTQEQKNKSWEQIIGQDFAIVDTEGCGDWHITWQQQGIRMFMDNTQNEYNGKRHFFPGDTPPNSIGY